MRKFLIYAGIFLGTPIIFSSSLFLIPLFVGLVFLDFAQNVLNLYFDLFLSFLAVLIFQILLSKKLKLSFFKIVVPIGLLGIIPAFALFLILASLDSRPGHHPDQRRISDMKQMQLAVEIYFNEHRSYPPVSSFCSDVNVLNQYLAYEGFIAVVPQERFLEEVPNYMVAVSPDGANYVIRAVLASKENPALNTDLDGIIMGCECDDPVYCVGP